jgi:hypothetical protein
MNNANEVQPYCLGMMMDTRITEMQSVRTDYRTLYEFKQLLRDILNDMDYLEAGEVEEFEILLYLKLTALYSYFVQVENKVKSVQPNSIVNFKIRIDDALFIMKCLSMQEDNYYSSDLRIFRSLMNEIVSKNTLITMFARNQLIENVKVNVPLPINIKPIGNVIANNFTA